MTILLRSSIIIFSLLKTLSALSSPSFLCEGTEASFSPDGKKIAYIYIDNIWVRNLKGTHRVQITHLQNCHNPCWSANGKKVVFQSYGRYVRHTRKVGHFSIWIVNTDGSQAHQISEQTNVEDQGPKWSNDNSKIIWTHDKQLWICDTTGKHPHSFTTLPAKAYENDGIFSPDGRTVAYVREDRYSVPELWLIDSSSQNQRFTGMVMHGQCIRWSHDGLFLYYLGSRGIEKINPNNISQAQYVSDAEGYDAGNYFDISPDEQFIIYDTSGPEVDNPKIILTKMNDDN